MAQGLPRLYVVCYDITEPKRLARVHRHLKKGGLPLQYSVFLVRTNAGGLDRLLGELADLIDPDTDDVRAYPLPERLEYTHLGRRLLPDGVSLVGADLPASLFHGTA
jgi:CRISPR-associated protein Cas2